MKYIFGLISVSVIAGCTALGLPDHARTDAPDVPSEQDKVAAAQAAEPNGYDVLWDGETFDGWRFVDGSPAAADRWIIDAGQLTSIKSDVPRAKDTQSLFTEASYSNFKLVFDFKVEDGANSGVKYLAIPGEASLPEYQLVPPEADGSVSNRGLGSLFDIAAPEITSDSGEAGLPLNDEDWQTGKIVIKGSQIQHWLNGVKLLDVDRCSPEFDARVSESLFKDEPGFAKRASGKIMLQYNDGGVAFRNLKIKRIGAESDAASVCGET